MSKKLKWLIVAVFVIVIIGFLGFKSSEKSFYDMSLMAGVSEPYYKSMRTDIGGALYMKSFITFGAAWGDYNNDSCIDLYVSNPIGPNKLYKNNCDGTFTDVAKLAGVDYNGPSTGTAWGDINNDLCLDLYVSSFRQKNILYKNKCDGTFEDITDKAHVGGMGSGSTSVAWVDYNNDGYLDIFVTNLESNTPQSKYVFSDNETNEDIIVFSGYDYLFRNNGDETFSEVAKDAGLAGVSKEIHFAKILSEQVPIVSGISYSSAWADFNRDGCIDVIVANDVGVSPLYSNTCNGTFINITTQSGLWKKGSGMGFAVADLTGDSYLDIYQTNYFDDYLWINNRNGSFSEKALDYGINSFGAEVGWGAVFFDFDNDGDNDLFIANGAVFGSLDFKDVSALHSTNRFYINTGIFKEATNKTNLANNLRSYGVASADYDEDGYIDLYVTNVNGPNNLYKNNLKGNNWIKISLVGTKSNSLGIGAEVEIQAGNLTIIDQMKSGTSYLSQNSYILHFGIGKTDKINSIRIKWPSGTIQILTDIKPNQHIKIVEHSYS